MKRRDFLAKVGVGLTAVALPFLPKPRKKLKAVWSGEVTQSEIDYGAQLMGYRGTDFVDAGFVHAPYIPLVRIKL